MITRAPGTGRGRPPTHPIHAHLDHREVHAMNTHIEILRAVHADRLARLHAEAHRARLVPSRSEARRLRRALGHSLVRAGQRIAAEASTAERPIEHLTPAGSR